MARGGEYILSEEGERTILNERLNDEIIVFLLKTNTDDELAQIFPSILDRARLRACYLGSELKDNNLKKAAQALCDLQQPMNKTIGKEFSCKYCGKSLKSHYAVRYHEDNNVCAKNPYPTQHDFMGKKLRIKKGSAFSPPLLPNNTSTAATMMMATEDHLTRSSAADAGSIDGSSEESS
jgi:hypothetical protein